MILAEGSLSAVYYPEFSKALPEFQASPEFRVDPFLRSCRQLGRRLANQLPSLQHMALLDVGLAHHQPQRVDA